MNPKKEKPTQFGENIITAITVGFFFIVLGIIFVLTPNLFGDTVDFLQSFDLVDVPNTNIIFPAPRIPQNHLTVYQAIGQFSIALSALQIIVLVLRFFVSSSWSKRAENVGNFVFWIGAAFLIQTFLIDTSEWFVFLSTILVVIGISMIVRAIVTAASRN